MTEIRAALCRQWPAAAALLVASLSAGKTSCPKRIDIFSRMVQVLLASLNCWMSTLRLVHYALLLTPACLSLIHI